MNPPRSNVRAERELLSAIMLAPDVLVDVEPHVTPADFFESKNMRMFAGMIALRDRGATVEPVALEQEVAKHGVSAEYVADICAVASASTHAEQHARMIADHAVARRIGETAEAIASKARDSLVSTDDLAEFASEKIFAASMRRTGTDPVSLGDGINEVYKRIEAGADSTTGGLTTGLTEIDRVSGGFCAGQLVILAARPRVGKSALAMQIATHIAATTGVLVFSLEMSRSELVERLLANEGRLNHRLIRRLCIGPDDMNTLVAAAERVYSLPLHIDETGALPIGEIRARSRRHARRHKLGLVVVDYLQLVVGPRMDNREQTAAAISRGLKALAKELNVPILALAQLNRGGRDKPTLESLRESGGIEQDADIVMLLHRDELVTKNSQKRGVADLIFAKQRSAESEVTIELKFTGTSVRFDNLDNGPPPEEPESYNPYTDN